MNCPSHAPHTGQLVISGCVLNMINSADGVFNIPELARQVRIDTGGGPGRILYPQPWIIFTHGGPGRTFYLQLWTTLPTDSFLHSHGQITENECRAKLGGLAVHPLRSLTLPNVFKLKILAARRLLSLPNLKPRVEVRVRKMGLSTATGKPITSDDGTTVYDFGGTEMLFPVSDMSTLIIVKVLNDNVGFGKKPALLGQWWISIKYLILCPNHCKHRPASLQVRPPALHPNPRALNSLIESRQSPAPPLHRCTKTRRPLTFQSPAPFCSPTQRCMDPPFAATATTSSARGSVVSSTWSFSGRTPPS